MVNQKVHKVLAAGLKPILCIGETKDEYELGINKLVRRGGGLGEAGTGGIGWGGSPVQFYHGTQTPTR